MAIHNLHPFHFDTIPNHNDIANIRSRYEITCGPMVSLHRDTRAHRWSGLDPSEMPWTGRLRALLTTAVTIRANDCSKTAATRRSDEDADTVGYIG